ncbi:MAG TPA: hypothetical protein VGG44_07100 [Tepidisphaeraceae bacterium]|jgi:hypothetical protein
MLETRTLLSVATVNAGTTINAVPTDLLGVNTAPWDGLLSNAGTLTLAQAAGLDSVRLGGGSYVDANWHFNLNNQSNTIGQQAEFAASLNASAIIDVNYGTASPEEAVAEWAYLNGNPNDTTSIASLFGNNAGDAEQWNTSTSSWTQGVNWQSVGYWASLRAASPVNGNPDGLNFLRINHAAFNFTTWEMGNEIYGSWEMDEHGTGGDALPMPIGDTLAAHDPTTLISFSKQFQTAINSILSDGFESGAQALSIGIDAQNPGNAGTNGFGPGTDGNWISDILSQSATQGFSLGYIADHYYTNDSGTHASDSGLLAVSNSAAGAPISGLSSYTNSSNPYNWQTRSAMYDTLFNTFLPGQNIKLIADEVNSISGNPGEQSTSLVNGLFVADALGSILDTTGADGLGGYQGFDIWDLHNGPFTANFTSRNLYGWRMGGDYGILGNANGAAAPIDGSNEPYPDYFAIQLASKIIQNGGTVVSASEDNETSVDTYAVMESNGDLELLVINKTKPTTGPPNNLPDQTLTEQFNITGFSANDAATIWQYGPAQDDAQDNTTSDATSLMTSGISLGISGGSFSFALPDYSMSVFILTPAGTAPLTVSQAAAANPSPVTGTTTSLSALGSENGSGSGLNYTWTATSVPNGVTAPTYSINGTNASATTTATFFGSGNYTFQVTITDASSNSVTSTVNVAVNPTLTSIVLNPTSATINENASQVFTASAKDQFNIALSSQPTFTWSVISGPGSVNATGRYGSGTTTGVATVQAASGSVAGTAMVTVNNATPTVAQAAAANANPVTGTSTALTVLGADDGGESNLTYTWGALANVSYSGTTNGTNASKNITANFAHAGNYNLTVTITDAGGLFVTSSVLVNVQQTPTGVIVTPSSVTVAASASQQFSATATDQFGDAISSPTFGWGITGAGNSINSAGLATLGSTLGTFTVTATLGAASNTAGVTVAATPIVSAFQVNDGNVQRAMVDSLTLTFNESVLLAGGAITLNLLSQTGGPSTPISNFNLNSPDGGTTWVLTFTNPSYIGGSLPDGAYEVSVSAAGVTGQGLNMAASQNFTLYRLYGDFNGTNAVTGEDFTQLVQLLGRATNSSNWYTDYDGDGVISGIDFTAFVSRLGTSMSIPSLPSIVLLAAAPPVTTPAPTPSTTISNTKPASVFSNTPLVATVTKPAAKPKPRHGHR